MSYEPYIKVADLTPEQLEERERKKQEKRERYRQKAFIYDKYWRKKREKQTKGKIRYFSISKKLKRLNKTTEEFEAIFNSLSLEEVIGLKLELASRSINGKLYNLPLWNSLLEILKEAVLKYAVSASKNRVQMAHFLGMKKSLTDVLLYKYNVTNYFSCLEEKKDDNK